MSKFGATQSQADDVGGASLSFVDLQFADTQGSQYQFNDFSLPSQSIVRFIRVLL